MEHMGAETQPPHTALHNTNRIFKMCLTFTYLHFCFNSVKVTNASLMYLTDLGPRSQPCTLWKQHHASVVKKIVFWQE